MADSFNIKVERSAIPNVCRAMRQFESEFDVGNHKNVIDGKDIAGFYDLDTSKVLSVQCILKKNETMKEIMESLKEYVIS